jgi:hypothetical protein
MVIHIHRCCLSLGIYTSLEIIQNLIQGQFLFYSTFKERARRKFIRWNCVKLSDMCFIITNLKQCSLHVNTYLFYCIRIKEKHHVSTTWQSADIHYLPIFFVQNSVIGYFSYTTKITLNFKLNNFYVTRKKSHKVGQGIVSIWHSKGILFYSTLFYSRFESISKRTP